MRISDGSSDVCSSDLFAANRRERLVIATKYMLPSRPGDPNSGGNHRKSMMRSVEGSLDRLKTDYIDLLYLHAWDFTTSVDEVIRGLDALVRSGKVVYVGISRSAERRVGPECVSTCRSGWSPYH